MLKPIARTQLSSTCHQFSSACARKGQSDHDRERRASAGGPSMRSVYRHRMELQLAAGCNGPVAAVR
jgi:hypothetical protein